MSNAKLIAESLLNRYKEGVAKHDKPKMSTLYEEFLKTVQPYVTEQLKTPVASASGAKGKGKGKAGSDSSEKKYNTWARCWASTEYGGKGYFEEDYTEIKEEQKQLKADKSDDFVGDSHFTILKLLRDRLEAEDGQTRWVQWYEWVQEENPDAPGDAPTERKTGRM